MAEIENKNNIDIIRERYEKLISLPCEAKDAHALFELMRLTSHFHIFSEIKMTKTHEELCKHLQIKPFEKGEVIFKQGDDGDNYYFILNGCVDLYVLDVDPHNGKTRLNLVRNCLPGEGFGELSVLYDCPRAHTAITPLPTSVIYMRKKIYRKYVKDFHEKELFEFIKFFYSIPIFENQPMKNVIKFCLKARKAKLNSFVPFIKYHDYLDEYVIIKSGIVKAFYKIKVTKNFLDLSHCLSEEDFIKKLETLQKFAVDQEVPWKEITKNEFCFGDKNKNGSGLNAGNSNILTTNALNATKTEIGVENLKTESNINGICNSNEKENQKNNYSDKDDLRAKENSTNNNKNYLINKDDNGNFVCSNDDNCINKGSLTGSNLNDNCSYANSNSLNKNSNLNLIKNFKTLNLLKNADSNGLKINDAKESNQEESIEHKVEHNFFPKDPDETLNNIENEIQKNIKEENQIVQFTENSEPNSHSQSNKTSKILRKERKETQNMEEIASENLNRYTENLQNQKSVLSDTNSENNLKTQNKKKNENERSKKEQIQTDREAEEEQLREKTERELEFQKMDLYEKENLSGAAAKHKQIGKGKDLVYNELIEIMEFMEKDMVCEYYASKSHKLDIYLLPTLPSDIIAIKTEDFKDISPELANAIREYSCPVFETRRVFKKLYKTMKWSKQKKELLGSVLKKGY